MVIRVRGLGFACIDTSVPSEEGVYPRMERNSYPVKAQGNSAAAYRQFLGKDSRIAGLDDARRARWLTSTIAKALTRCRSLARL